MHKEIQARAERAIQEKVFPGCVIGVVRKMGEREVILFGNFTYEADSQKVAEDTVYDLASITKSVPVASLVLTSVGEGRLRLEDAVVKYLPELKNDYGATIEDLLTYRVRGTRLSILQNKTPDEILRSVFEHGFEAPTGKASYSNAPALLLGIILERVMGEPLDHLAQQQLFEPLKMRDTSFFPSDISRIPPTEIVGGTEIRGIVHDESERVFARARRAVGHAGLFSTVPDILNFLEALLRSRDDGDTISIMRSIADGAQRGLGWQRAEPWFAGSHTGRHAFGKTGFTGTSVLCDVERGTALVILSNRTYPTRPPDAASIHSAINTFRADIADIFLR